MHIGARAVAAARGIARAAKSGGVERPLDGGSRAARLAPRRSHNGRGEHHAGNRDDPQARGEAGRVLLGGPPQCLGCGPVTVEIDGTAKTAVKRVGKCILTSNGAITWIALRLHHAPYRPASL
jgi:hypothetical protein